jgi:hypothetical protein
MKRVGDDTQVGMIQLPHEGNSIEDGKQGIALEPALRLQENPHAPRLTVLSSLQESLLHQVPGVRGPRSLGDAPADPSEMDLRVPVGGHVNVIPKAFSGGLSDRGIRISQRQPVLAGRAGAQFRHRELMPLDRLDNGLLIQSFRIPGEELDAVVPQLSQLTANRVEITTEALHLLSLAVGQGYGITQLHLSSSRADFMKQSRR